MLGFDKCLGGGLQNKSFNLIYGPSGTGKTSLCFSLIKSLLENHYTVVFVNIDEEITELKNRYSSYKIAFIQNEKNRRLIFIDAFSAMAELQKSLNPYAILAKPYAENLNFNIIKAIKDTTKHRFVFIDSISSMLIHDDISLVQKSLCQLYLKSKVMNLHVFLIIIDGMHSRETLVTVNIYGR